MNTDKNFPECQADPATAGEEASVMSTGGHAAGFFTALRMTGMGVLFLFGLFASGGAQEPEMRLSPRKVREEVRAVVDAQLVALRESDLTTAYGYAARGIKRQFDARLFGLMIKRGYAPLLRQDKSDLGVVRDNGEGMAQVTVTVTDRLNRSTVYNYWLVKEEEGWRISGVVLEQKSPRSDI